MYELEWTLSDFLRRSGEVLDAAEQHDVILTRRQCDDLILTTAPRQQSVLEAIKLLLGMPGLQDMLTSAERKQARCELIAATKRGDLGSIGLTNAKWLSLARMRRAQLRGRVSPPVASPPSQWDTAIRERVVSLPLRIAWSAVARTYDVSVDRQRRALYELVLTNGTSEDVARFVDPVQLAADLPELVLPRRVREIWNKWKAPT